MTPVDIIAAGMRAALRGPVAPGFAEGWAKVAAESLTDPAIVATAVQALKDDLRALKDGGAWESLPAVVRDDLLVDDDLVYLARTVLRSVGGA